MLGGREQVLQASGLFVGERVGAGVQGASGVVERVALAAPVSVQGLLDPAPALIEGLWGRSASQVVNACLERPSTMDPASWPLLILKTPVSHPRQHRPPARHHSTLIGEEPKRPELLTVDYCGGRDELVE